MAIDVSKMSAQEWADWNMQVMTKALTNKYRARRTEYAGITYDSKAEADYAAELDLRLKSEQVEWWLRQIIIPLGPDCRTRIDFLVATYSGHPGYRLFSTIHGVEIKGAETREFKRVRKLWPKYGPFDLHVIKRGNVEILEGRCTT